MKLNSNLKFTKSNDRFIAGVCGGIAERFGWDKALTRIIALVAIIISHGILLIPYIILAWIMPSKESNDYQRFTDQFSFMTGNAKKTRKEIKDVEEHDVNE